MRFIYKNRQNSFKRDNIKILEMSDSVPDPLDDLLHETGAQVHGEPHVPKLLAQSEHTLLCTSQLLSFVFIEAEKRI
jgi:hypothetical protein